ncbi:MAG: dockerin type I repeat-containing protein [Ruminococcus callidus]
MFEDTLEVQDSIDVVIGESETLTVNIPNCTGTMADRTVAGVAADKDDTLKLVITGKNVGSTTLTVTTPGGQTKEVTVNVLPQQTTVTTAETTTTTTTTTTSATTTTTEKTTATTTVGSTETTTTTEEVIIPLYGDVNCDSRVDITDAVMLNKAIAGVVTLGTRQQKANADCDGDGEIASNDAVALLKFLVSLVKQLPYAD